MKKQKILKSFLLSMLILTVSAQVYASEITGILSSTGAVTQQNLVSTSGATATPTSPVSPSSIPVSVAANNNSQMSGNVIGGASAGGLTSNSNLVSGASSVSSGSSGGSGTRQDGLVLGVSTTSQTSSKPKTASLSSGDLASVPETSKLAVTQELLVEDASLAQTDTNNENTGLMVGESELSTNSASIEETLGFESATWFWIVMIGLVLLLVIIYRYIRNAGDDANRIR